MENLNSFLTGLGYPELIPVSGLFTCCLPVVYVVYMLFISCLPYECDDLNTIVPVLTMYWGFVFTVCQCVSEVNKHAYNVINILYHIKMFDNYTELIHTPQTDDVYTP